jgi:hypothetical protein
MLILRNTASSHHRLIHQRVTPAILKRHRRHSYRPPNLLLAMLLLCLPRTSPDWLVRWTTRHYKLYSLVLDRELAKEHLHPLNHNSNRGTHRLTSTPFLAV